MPFQPNKIYYQPIDLDLPMQYRSFEYVNNAQINKSKTK